MNIIGIIAPNESRNNKSNIVKRNKPEFIFVEKHLVCFVVAYDNCNYNKIFRKNNVEIAVVADGAKLKKTPKVKICDGQDFYSKNLMYFITKSFKLYGLNSETSSIAIVCNNFEENVLKLIKQVSKIFRYIILVTENIRDGEEIANEMMDEYGVFIEIRRKNEAIICDLAVELEKENIKYPDKTVVLNIDSNISAPKEYYLSLPYKIPFKANSMAMSEALSVIKQSIDN